MKRPKRIRRAFTLVEVLVVLALVGFLVALLVPALRKAREAALRVRCENNLRQLAAGFQRHQDTHDCLPSGGGNKIEDRRIVSGAPALYDQQTWGWGYQLLPFIGQDKLWGNSDDFEVAGSPVQLYSCPALRPPTAFAFNETGIWRYQDPPRQRYMMDYAGNGGSSGGFWSFSRASDGLLTPTGTGLVSLAEVPDGAANTLMIGEKYLNPLTVRLHPCQCNDSAGWVAGWDSNTIGFGSYDPPRRNADFGPEPCYCGSQFGSSHPTGMQAAFGDGSVRTLAFNLDLDVWQAIISTSDGARVRLP